MTEEVQYHYILSRCSCINVECYQCGKLWALKSIDINIIKDEVYCPSCGSTGRVLNKIV